MNLWEREARLFKYGSGTGSNFLRPARRGAKNLSGGGKSSGLMSFLKIGDRAAGAIKSGGTTRRAAKMVVVDIDHPDVEEFINWKVLEEQKVAALVTGSKICRKHLSAIMDACQKGESDNRFNPSDNPALKSAMKEAHKALVPDNYIQRVVQFAKQGFTELEFPEYDTDWDSEAYLTVSGQNSNNSVRVTNEFLEAVEHNKPWHLLRRKDNKVSDTIPARDLWDQVAYAAWGLRRSGTAVRHHHHRVAHLSRVRPHPRQQSLLGIHVPRRHGVQPRLDQPAQVQDGERHVNIKAFEYATRLWTIVLEISVAMAQFPSKEIAQLSYEFRTLGLGYANIGGF